MTKRKKADWSKTNKRQKESIKKKKKKKYEN